MGLFKKGGKSKIPTNHENYLRKMNLRFSIRNAKEIDLELKKELFESLNTIYPYETNKPDKKISKSERRESGDAFSKIEIKVNNLIEKYKQEQIELLNKVDEDEMENINEYNFNTDKNSILKGTDTWYNEIKEIEFIDNVEMNDVPEWVHKFKNLNKLSITNSKSVRLLPSWIGDLPLKVLVLENTGIQVYPSKIMKKLKSLEEINFNGTNFVVQSDYDKSIIIRSIEKINKQVGISIEVNKEKYDEIMSKRKKNIEEIDLILRGEKEL